MVSENNKIVAFFRLIRYPNLLIIIATMCLMRWAIILPILKVNGFQLQFSNIQFVFLVLSTVFLSAGGYVINDYFDRKTDLVNRPQTVIVGTIIKRRSAMAIHIVLNVFAIITGFYLAFSIGLPNLGLIFIIVSGILWFYSTTYKRQLLVGNLIVSFLVALVPLMVLLFEIPLLNRAYGNILAGMGENFHYLTGWILGFSGFAFLTTLIREIVKDVEDFEGDQAFGRQTLPVVIGVRLTKLIIIVILFITIVAIFYVYFVYLTDKITLLYILITLIIPMFLGIIFTIKAKNKKNYHQLSTLLKVIMLAGILYALVADYIISIKF